MAWVSTLGPDMAQIDYRLKADAGCSLSAGDDAQVAYRLDADRPLEWIGDGVREVGFAPGQELDDAGVAAARALANGRDPREPRRVLVAPKLAVDPRAKLDAAPLVDAVRAAADAAGVSVAGLLTTPRVAARYRRLERGVARVSAGAGAHRAPVADLERVATAAGVDLDAIYEPGVLEFARQHRDARVPVGNRGYDLTLDLPKSYSVLMAMALPEVARELEDVYLDAVRETVTAMQGWAGYGMRGHHGDGRTAERVDGTGLVGWMTVHRTARPVAGKAPDPHLHAHVTLLNLVRGVDGQWSTIGAGGRDIHRHAHAADALLKARIRAVTRERWGVEWSRDPGTGAWEIAAVPAELRRVMSKRAGQVADRLTADGLDPKAASTKRAKTAAARTREAKQPSAVGGDLRAEWHRQAVAAGVDPQALVAAAMPGPDGGPVRTGPAGPSPTPDPQVVAAYVWRPEDGLTGHRKTVTRADVLAAVLDAVPAGVDALVDAEQLVDRVLALDTAVPLPAAGATHLSNAQRYTTTDVVDAERTVLAAARDRHAGGYPAVPVDVLALAVKTFETGAGITLGAEQRAVLARLAGDGHGVDAVIGVAGAGKTTIMSALRSAYEATGQTVAGAATAAVAVQNLTAETGIEARTVAAWLHRIEDGEGLRGVDVLVVDEAAMVDDRHLARLAAAAGTTGTKLVLIGDPMQLKAVGIGGTFAAVHELMNGLSLTDNRRQRDVDERHALTVWRADQRRGALEHWNDTGRVHAVDTPAQAHEAMTAAWDTARQGWADPYERIERLLLLAHTNADVDALNGHARALRVAASELDGPAGTWWLADGRRLDLAVGDQVLLRINDRTAGVLNGHRGIVTDLDARGRVQITRRETGPDGPRLVTARVSAGYITRGGVQHGYAITAAKAQGLTADRTLVYGNGMEANVLYPAMSRDRDRADLWLALAPLEDDADRARYGVPADDAEARARAVAAYAAALEHDLPDRLVLTELGQAPDPIRPADSDRPHRKPAEPAPARDSIAYWHSATARLAQLPDDALRAEPTRLEQAVRSRRANTDPAGYRAAEQARARAMLAELHTIAAGGDASGSYPRSELAALAGRMRATAERRQREADLHAALAQAQAAAPAGIPAGAASYVDWTRRPYGEVPGEQLPARIAEADLRAAAQTERAAQASRAVQALAAQITAGASPALVELRAQRERLQARVEAGVRAAQARAAEQAAHEQARQAWAEVRRLDGQARRNRIVLRLSGTSRARLAAQQEQLRQQARAAGEQAGRHAARAWELERDAGGRGGAQRAAAELADLTRDWDTRHADAAGRDQRTADTYRDRAQHATGEAGRWQRAAAGLRDEAHLRQRLDPLTARAENLGRQAEQTRQQAASRDAARRTEAALAAHNAPHRHGPTIVRGPSLG